MGLGKENNLLEENYKCVFKLVKELIFMNHFFPKGAYNKGQWEKYNKAYNHFYD
jgi:hypothetical protein